MQSYRTNQGKPTTSKRGARPKTKHLKTSVTDYDNDTFQRQALEVPLPCEHFDPSAEPQNGEEYLLKVLHERKRYPVVVVNRPKNLEQPEQQASTAKDYGEPFDMTNEKYERLLSSFRTSPEWKCEQEASFLAVRNKVNTLRLELHAHNYNSELEPPLTNKVSEWKKFCGQHAPLLSIILRISQRSLEQLLDMLAAWLHEGEDPPTAPEVLPAPEEEETTMEQEDEEPVLSSSGAAAAIAKSDEPDAASVPFDLSTTDQWMGPWLYATLACLQLPLEPSVLGTLRDIARVCIQLRNRLSPDDAEKAIPYNLFIWIISKVFEQLDFAKFV